MAQATYYTFLMHGTGSTSSITYSKLVDIEDYPDLIGTPEATDVSDLSSRFRHSIPGLITNDQKTFNCHYSETDYSTIKALEDEEQHFAIWFGATVSGSTVTPDGSLGKFEFDGYVNVGIPAAGVGDERKMTVTITPTSDVVLAS